MTSSALVQNPMEACLQTAPTSFGPDSQSMGRKRDEFSGRLVIMDADTGKELHSIDVGTSIHAAPMSYVGAGEQYEKSQHKTLSAYQQLHEKLATHPPDAKSST